MAMQGKTIIADAVFVEIAREAMHKVEEVYRQDRKGGLASISKLFDKYTPQISAKKTEPEDTDETGTVAFDLKVTMVYGVKIPEVAQKARDRIMSEVEELTGYKVERVDITVERLIMPEDLQEDKKDE